MLFKSQQLHIPDGFLNLPVSAVFLDCHYRPFSIRHP